MLTTRRAAKSLASEAQAQQWSAPSTKSPLYLAIACVGPTASQAHQANASTTLSHRTALCRVHSLYILYNLYVRKAKPVHESHLLQS